MCSVAHRVNTAGVDPTVIEIEQCTNSNRIIDRLVRISDRVQRFYVVRLNGNRFEIHLTHKTQQSLLSFRKRAAIKIGEYAIHELLAAEQFRRDRGVRLRSKRTLIEMRRVSGNEFAESRGERSGLS